MCKTYYLMVLPAQFNVYMWIHLFLLISGECLLAKYRYTDLPLSYHFCDTQLAMFASLSATVSSDRNISC
jgi:hypothetical protein